MTGSPTIPKSSALQTTETTDTSVWTEMVSRTFVPLTVRANPLTTFSGRLRSRAIGDIYVCEVAAREHSVERTPAQIAQGDKDYYKLSLQLGGTGFLVQDGREALLHPGDIAIYDTDRPYTLSFEGAFTSLVVMFPKQLIDLPPDAVGQLTATRFCGDEGLTSMVGPFLTHLTKNMDRLGGANGLRLVHNSLDLVTTVLHSELDARVLDRRPTHRAALIQEVRAYIDEHLSDPELHPGQIAAGNFISTRYLHGIFKDQGVTVAAWIRSRRLEHCRRDLADPVYAHKSVSTIASRWGFVDASHFSRLFRGTFGEAPSEFRERSAADFAAAE